jgi:hypothetical protein
MGRVFIIINILVQSASLLIGAESGHAQQDPTKPDFEIPKTHIEVRVLPSDHVPKPDIVPEGVGKETEPAQPEDPMEALRNEVETMRDELRLLQATLDLLVNQVMGDLREENEFLRKELQRQHDSPSSSPPNDPTRVPRPGIDLIREVLEAQPDFVPDTPPEVPQPETVERVEISEEGEPEPFVFTIVQEWGRTPEDVEELGGDATSLKGMVGIVPSGSKEEDLEQLGRDLRKQFDVFDNINIEVFDDMEAAQRYYETQIGHSEHRMLSVSKHAASGRDVILYFHNGETIEVAQ